MIIKFCTTSCCPYVEFKDGFVYLGDPNGDEGVTKWTTDQFNMFIKSAKNGDFDIR